MLTVIGGFPDGSFGHGWITDELQALAGLYHSCVPSSCETGAKSEARNSILPHPGSVLNQITEQLLWGLSALRRGSGDFTESCPWPLRTEMDAGFHGGLKVGAPD